MDKALGDLMVIDLTRYISGPYCATILADMGAYVIKVEKPGIGEEMRVGIPFFNGQALSFPPYNRNKKSLCMDLRNPKAIEILKKLIVHADVLIQNYRPGTIEKMGLSYEVCKELNPRLIMLNISGFGQTGPHKHRAAYDGVIQAESGLTNSIMQESGGIPVLPAGNPCDVMTALHSAIAVLCALNQRDITGRGQYVDVDMMSCITGMFSPQLCYYDKTGKEGLPHAYVPYGNYRTIDGAVHISVKQEQWPRFRQLLNVPELQSPKYDDFTGRLAEEAEINKAIEGWTKQRTSLEIVDMLAKENIAVGMMKHIDQVAGHEQLLARDNFVDLEVYGIGKAPYPKIPFKMSGTKVEYNSPPTVGEHNKEILSRYLNMSAKQVEELQEQKVLYATLDPHY